MAEPNIVKRIRNYDYGASGYYFVTICSDFKKKVFGRIIQGDINLSRLGNLIETNLISIPAHFSFVKIDEYVVMPNHLHAILYNERSGTIYRATTVEKFGEPLPGSLPTVIRTIKASVTRTWRKKTQNSEMVVWQRGYYERVIRSDRELNSIRNYIHNNPLKWELDRHYSG